MKTPLRSDQVAFLRARWDRNLINRIVNGLNAGVGVASLLQDLKQHAEAPPFSGRIDLRGIDLSHQNLRGPWIFIDEIKKRSGIALTMADLSHANLAWALLPRADFRGALMEDVRLDSAELIHADFSGAELTGATFEGAWLLDTRFKEATIEEAQLKRRRKLGQLDFDYHAFSQ